MKEKKKEIFVLIATADSMTGELLRAALNRQSRFNVIRNVSTSVDVINIAKGVIFDVVLIGTTLADGPQSGITAMRQLRDSSLVTKTILLLDERDDILVEDAFRVGAKGVFSLSSSSFKDLCKCVERVHSGHIWANQKELAAVMEAFSRLAPMKVVRADGMNLLTKREESVVRLLAEGMQNREIARELNLSEHTIKNYLFHIFDKLGVSSRVELVLYAVSATKRMQFEGAPFEEHYKELACISGDVMKIM